MRELPGEGIGHCPLGKVHTTSDFDLLPYRCDCGWPTWCSFCRKPSKSELVIVALDFGRDTSYREQCADCTFKEIKEIFQKYIDGEETLENVEEEVNFYLNLK